MKRSNIKRSNWYRLSKGDMLFGFVGSGFVVLVVHLFTS